MPKPNKSKKTRPRRRRLRDDRSFGSSSSSTSSSSESSEDEALQEYGVRNREDIEGVSAPPSLCACLMRMFVGKSREELIIQTKQDISQSIKLTSENFNRIELRVAQQEKWMRKAIIEGDMSEAYRHFSVWFIAKQKLRALQSKINLMESQLFQLDELQSNTAMIEGIEVMNRNVNKLKLGKTLDKAEETMHKMIASSEDMNEFNTMMLSEQQASTVSQFSEEAMKAEFEKIVASIQSEIKTSATVVMASPAALPTASNQDEMQSLPSLKRTRRKRVPLLLETLDPPRRTKREEKEEEHDHDDDPQRESDLLQPELAVN